MNGFNTPDESDISPDETKTMEGVFMCQVKMLLVELNNFYIKTEAKLEVLSANGVTVKDSVFYSQLYTNKLVTEKEARHLAQFHCECIHKDCLKYYNDNFL